MSKYFAVLLTVFFAGSGDNFAETGKEATSNFVSAIAVDVDAENLRIQAAIAVFASTLQSELKTAMQQGGPVKAIDVCNSSAQAISESVSVSQGLQISRVSLRNRNPANQALDWQIPVLESFDKLQSHGAEPGTLTWSDLAEIDGKQQYRYMQAIPTGQLCLQCHGSNLAPHVSAKLDALYPEDKARGYSEGEIRGAFAVTRMINE